MNDALVSIAQHLGIDPEGVSLDILVDEVAVLTAAPELIAPEGWQLVPKMATTPMLLALGDLRAKGQWAFANSEAWRNMLTAAPVAVVPKLRANPLLVCCLPCDRTEQCKLHGECLRERAAAPAPQEEGNRCAICNAPFTPGQASTLLPDGPCHWPKCPTLAVEGGLLTARNDALEEAAHLLEVTALDRTPELGDLDPDDQLFFHIQDEFTKRIRALKSSPHAERGDAK